MKRTEDSLRDIWNNNKRTNIQIIGVPEEEDKKKVYGKIFEEIIDSMDCSLPGSSVHGILQMRVLEWGKPQSRNLARFTGVKPQ